MNTITFITTCAFWLGPSLAIGQSETTPAPSIESAAADTMRQLEESLAELSALREQMAAEKLPMARRLSDLEGELTNVRLEFQQITRLLDNRTLDLSNVRTEIKARQEEASYLSNLLGEYIRNFESRLHIAEMQRYRDRIEAGLLAPENSNFSQREIYEAQAGLLGLSLDRIEDLLGGARFDGIAVDGTGLVQQGTFVMIGPSAIFATANGQSVGTVEQRLGSLEPTMMAFETPEDITAALAVVANGEGLFPFDPTQGNAHKIAATKETLLEHVKKGGPVMYPIFALAGIALLVAVLKWLQLLFVRKPSKRRVRKLLEAVAKRDREGALKAAKAVRGPAGRMLTAGVQHLDEPRQLIEEVMYETVLSTRLRLQRFLPFVAVSAAAAPLLGLLGTVTGIMNTFTLITVFGTGDVKTLSSGISEALITTEFGLIVAIPSLLLHAFLSRKARGIVDQMEKAAVAFANQVSRTPLNAEAEVKPKPQATEDAQSNDSALTARQIREMFEELLKPMLAPTAGPGAAPMRHARKDTHDSGESESAPTTHAPGTTRPASTAAKA